MSMEANELINNLMIGDWVKCTDSTPMQITRIDSRGMLVENQDTDEVGLEDLQPIPLTEEMLRNNNLTYFHKCYEYDEWEVKTIKCSTWYTVDISHTIDENYDYMINDFPIRYVHEFQHLLRLCGLTDLADNFKIE